MPAQVPVLNAHGMSLDEYHWAKGHVLDSLGQIQKEDFAKMIAEGKARMSGPPDATARAVAEGRPATGVLAANVALVRPYDDPESNVFEVSMVGF